LFKEGLNALIDRAFGTIFFGSVVVLTYILFKWKGVKR